MKVNFYLIIGLYDFSRREYLQFQKTLQNLADFTCKSMIIKY